MRRLKPFFWATDAGFLVYWLITVLHAVPARYLYPDYQNPLVVAWNWSFLPLDLCVSATGFTALYLHKRSVPTWRFVALLSLALTFCSGLQAVGFWTMRCWFDWTWWLPNLYLLVYPLFFLPTLFREMYSASQPLDQTSNQTPAQPPAQGAVSL